nr:hypothetical protein [Tanacetum cinerariifolium]
MDNKKHIIDLELFRDILHICPRVHGQSFAETPFEEEILAFICFLQHSAAIRMLTDVNINKLYQPWISFAAIINKCLTGKSSGYDSLRLSQAQILWGLYHKRNDPSIPKRNKVNWHYVRHDHMFSTIKLVSRHQNMQQFGALLSIELTNDAIRNSKAYKEYYAIATGEAAPKPKASVRRTRSSSDTSITPPTAAVSPRLIAFAKGKQTAKASKAKSLSALSEVAMTEAQQLKLVTNQSMQQTHISQPSGSGADKETSSKPRVPDVPIDESKEELSWNSRDDEGDDNEEKDADGDEEDEGDDGEEGNGDDDDEDEDDDGEEGDDDVDQEIVRDDDKDDDEEGGDDKHEFDEETRDEESVDPILQTPEDSEDKGNGEEDLSLNIGEEERHDEEEEEDELFRDININQGRGIQATLAVEDSHVTLTLVHPDGQQESSSVSSQFVTSMLNLTLDVGMESIFGTTSQMDVQTPTSVASLPITAPTMTSSTIATTTTTSQALILPKTIPTTIPSNIIQNLPKDHQGAGQKQVKAHVSKILLRIEQDVNEQLEAEVLTQSSHSSRTSYAVAADLSEMELKKILIEKIEGNKSIQRSDKQRNFYKALVDAYESDKIIIDTYRETVTLKRRRYDDADKDEEPSAGPDRGSKRRRKGKEPKSASTPMETVTRSTGRSIQPWISELAKQADSHSSFNELMDTPLDFSNFLINWLKVDTLTPELLAGPTYELMKGSCKSLVEVEYHLEEVFKATTDQLDWVNLEGQQYLHNLLQPLPLIPNNQGHRVIPFEHFINNDLEYLRGGTSSRKYTTSITKTKAADYGHINIVIQRRVEDLQLGVESYQKKLNLTKPDSYRSDLNRKEAHTAYSNPRGFIYQNKDMRNGLMRIDELHKFSDGTLTDVRTALDDRLKRIRMQYFPQSIWRKSDKDRAAAMI